MTKIVDPYQERLNLRIDSLSPNISSSIDRIGAIDPGVALKILEELVSAACQATHTAAIVAGRTAIAKIPAEWLEPNLLKAVKTRLNLHDDWEFQRLLELLKEVRPSMIGKFVTAGFSSPDFDVREAAVDWAKGRHGLIEEFGEFECLFAERLNRRIDALYPNASKSLDRISSIDPGVALRILGKLMLHACQTTDDIMIIVARKMIAKLPAEWLEINLLKVVKDHLNLDDEWEYCRLMELLHVVRPAMMGQFITVGLSSPNALVCEAARDYAEGRRKPV